MNQKSLTFRLRGEGETMKHATDRKKKIERTAKKQNISEGKVIRNAIDTLWPTPSKKKTTSTTSKKQKQTPANGSKNNERSEGSIKNDMSYDTKHFRTIRHGQSDMSAHCRQCSDHKFDGDVRGWAKDHSLKTLHTVDVYLETTTEYTCYHKDNPTP